jgi:hypothetical protein
MRVRDLRIFLGLELLAIPWAALVFSYLQDHRTAGFLAGGYFVFSGLYMLHRARLWPRKWHSLTIYLLMVHVLLISLPMLISRIVQLESDFTNVRIFGIPGPEFHNLSTGVFSALIGVTLIDWWRAGRVLNSRPSV